LEVGNVFADAAKECATTTPYTTLAVTCIAWDDNPAGADWTLYQVKIFNPPNAGPSVLKAVISYNNGDDDGQVHTIGDGGTLTLNIPKPYAIGAATTLFVIGLPTLPDIYCNYRAPHGTETYICGSSVTTRAVETAVK
jgi:hypothetical protein